MHIFQQYRGLKRENYVLFFGRLVTNLGSMIWPMLTLILTEKMGYSAGEASLLMILAGVFLLPVNLLGGHLADRLNKKRVILLCDCISVTLYVVCSFLQLSVFTLVLVVLAAAAQMLQHPAYNGIIADITLTKDRERAFSLQYLGMNVGFVAAPTIAGFLFKDHLSLCFLISGLAILTSTALIFCLVKDIRPIHETTNEAVYQQEGDHRGILKILLSSRALLLYLFIMLLYHGAYSQYSFLMPIDLAARHGDMGSVIYGTVTSMNGVVCVLFTPLITRFCAKVNTVYKTLAGLVFLAAGYLLFLIPLQFVPLYYAAIFLFTLGEIFTTVANGAHMTTRVSSKHRGRITAIYYVMNSIGQSVCMLITGVLYDQTGNSLWPWIFVIIVVVIASSLCLKLLSKDKDEYPALYTAQTQIK